MRKTRGEGDEIFVLQDGANFSSEDELQGSVGRSTFSSTVRPYLSTVVNPNDFPIQNWPIYISHFNKFRLTANFYQFSCLLALFHTKIMLILYDMGLFFKELLLTHEIKFQSNVLTGSSASIPKFRLGFR